jgi:hypothetical protein
MDLLPLRKDIAPLSFSGVYYIIEEEVIHLLDHNVPFAVCVECERLCPRGSNSLCPGCTLDYQSRRRVASLAKDAADYEKRVEAIEERRDKQMAFAPQCTLCGERLRGVKRYYIKGYTQPVCVYCKATVDRIVAMDKETAAQVLDLLREEVEPFVPLSLDEMGELNDAAYKEYAAKSIKARLLKEKLGGEK